MIPFVISILVLLFGSLKLYAQLELSKTKTIIGKIMIILFIIWFSFLSIDYKRHKNLSYPLFCIGYDVIEEYDMNLSTGVIYKTKSTFYLLSLKIDEVNAIN